jgi:DNA-binding GntR family transcriptional regulator
MMHLNLYDEFVDKMVRENPSALDYLRSRILNFAMLPGVRISDEEVAKTLGTSRTPVREALNRLVEQGLVENPPNRGFIVKVFRKKEVEDHYILRESLECLAVRLAIRTIDQKKAAALKRLLATYPSVMRSNDLVRYSRADEAFHDCIALYSENTVLYETLRNLHERIHIVRRYDHLRVGSFEETYEEHQLILKHMIQRDVKQAMKVMSLHILKSMESVIQILPE